MNNKGLTLVELLGVITILGLLAAATITTMDSVNKKNIEKAYNTQIDNILSAAISYAPVNLSSELPESSGQKLCRKLSVLHKEGALEGEIKNPKTGKLFSMDTIQVCIEKVSLDEKSNMEKTLKNEKKPFKYNGNYIYYLEGLSS